MAYGMAGSNWLNTDFRRAQSTNVFSSPDDREAANYCIKDGLQRNLKDVTGMLCYIVWRYSGLSYQVKTLSRAFICTLKPIRKHQK
jgi:hypothetical protein